MGDSDIISSFDNLDMATFHPSDVAALELDLWIFSFFHRSSRCSVNDSSRISGHFANIEDRCPQFNRVEETHKVLRLGHFLTNCVINLSGIQ